MRFEEALKIMKDGGKVKLPSWGGFWKWDPEKESIIMHTKDGEEMDIRKTQVVEYTLGNVFPMNGLWLMKTIALNWEAKQHFLSGKQSNI